MSTVTDTFTDTAGTALESHAPNTGGAWTKVPGVTGGAQITASATLRPSSTADALYYNPTAPASADYTVAADVVVVSAPTGGFVGVVGRVNPATGEYYAARYQQGTGWVLYGISGSYSGGFSQLGTHAGAITGTHRLALTMSGSAISLLVDGASVIAVTDTHITAAGFGGVNLNGTGGYTDAAGYQLDNYSFPTATSPIGGNGLAPNTANLFYSPGNWVVTSGAAITPSPGAYLKTVITGTTTAALAVDGSALTAAGASSAGTYGSQYPTLKWRLGAGAWRYATLTSGQTSLSLATGLTPPSSYALEVHVVALANNLDRWNTPASALKVTALTLDTGGSVTAPTLAPRRALLLGDSITESVNLDNTYTDTLTAAQLPPSSFAHHDATQTWAVDLAGALGAEYGVAGFANQGWAFAAGAPYGNVPPLFTSGSAANTGYNQVYGGAARTMTGLDYVIVNEGTNDARNGVSDATVQATVQAFLTACRAAAGASTKIVLVVPFGQYKASAITAGFNAYQAATPDGAALLLDLGAGISDGLTTGAVSYESQDGLHPDLPYHARFAAMLAQQFQSKLATGGSSTGTGRVGPGVRSR